jgi:diadenosine tetraphosphatase ApaH/serine/threonine PP2A family protein phosphatase
MQREVTEADLGRLDGPVLVFGGPYSNLEAAEAIRAEAERLGIPPAQTICTGDTVAYCADPGATVALIRDWGIAVVQGNVEEQLGAGAEDCACGFTPGSACDTLAAQWYAHAEREITAGDRRWMAGLPRLIRFTLAGRRMAALHGGASRINRWVFASTPAAEKHAEMGLAGAGGAPVHGIVAGHCGLPFVDIFGGRLWCNAGTVGLPANDGTPRVWYAILTPERAGAIRIELRPLAYDHGQAAQKMRRAGLAEGYARALETGLWPPSDVLPAAERAATGRALTMIDYFWLLAERGVAA